MCKKNISNSYLVSSSGDERYKFILGFQALQFHLLAVICFTNEQNTEIALINTGTTIVWRDYYQYAAMQVKGIHQLIPQLNL